MKLAKDVRCLHCEEEGSLILTSETELHLRKERCPNCDAIGFLELKDGLNNYELYYLKSGNLPWCAFPGAYPILYMDTRQDVYCDECASRHVSDIVHHVLHMEGEPQYCNGCNKPVESAYGDPSEGDGEQEMPDFNEDREVDRLIQSAMVHEADYDYSPDDYNDDIDYDEDEDE